MLDTKNILLIGDAMLDIYMSGEVNRISPEAPVPVFRKRGERYVLGGASNVAANIAAANQRVTLLTCIGEDAYGKLAMELLNANGIDATQIVYWNRPTITKTRFLAENNQQVMRLDIEDTNSITPEEEAELKNRIERMISDYDLVLLSDYMKGVLTPKLTQDVIEIAKKHKIKVLVDVKDPDYEKYKGAWLLKPNTKELGALTKMPVSNDDEIVAAAKYLLSTAESEYVLTTCGSKGMILVGGNSVYRLDTIARAVYDVTGAGDTVIAYLSAALANSIEITKAMRLANYAAGLQVGKVGAATIHLHEVEEAMTSQTPVKIYGLDDRKELSARIACWRQKGEKIVTTNGCFDILHRGHVALLEKAKTYGERLIVMINSDASVKRLKGSTRPINNETDRAIVIAALDCVDAVAIFDPQIDNLSVPEEDTAGLSERMNSVAKEAPMGLLKLIAPDVHVKGGDYTIDQVPEAMYAGRFESVPFVEGYSTTRTIEKSRN